ncbi:DUF6338 family protein [Arthrobacter sp. FW306-04-A]|uniref:DUF6338 family protein n=1 Tax=Arthrobacter sp. FW306-04-A TaxID=2879619 RepID=UPI0037BF3C7B
MAPGFYYELERSRRFTRAQESPFYEVSRALVASIGIGIVAAAAAFIVWCGLTPWDPPDFTALLKRDPQYAGSHAAPLFASLVAYITAGATVVIFIHRLQPKIAAKWRKSKLNERIRLCCSKLADRIRPQRAKRVKPKRDGLETTHSIWSEVFSVQTPVDHEPFATALMKSGAVWMGKVGRFSTEHEVANRELVLTKPISYSPSLTSPLTKIPHIAIVLKGPEIEGFSVMYGLKEGLQRVTSDRLVRPGQSGR